MRTLKRLITDEEGQGLVEYSLILGVIAIAIIVFGPFIKTAITNIWSNVNDGLQDAQP